MIFNIVMSWCNITLRWPDHKSFFSLSDCPRCFNDITTHMSVWSSPHDSCFPLLETNVDSEEENKYFHYT